MAVERVIPGRENWAYAHADHLSRYLFAAPFASGKRVLDAGCGHGYGAALLAEFGAAQVVAIDIDAETIASAARNYADFNIEFRVDDCERLDTITDTFDVVCNFENIEHLHDPECFLSRVTEVVNGDGVFLCSSPDLRGPYRKLENGRTDNPYHINEWHVEEFQQMLLRFFQQVDVRQQVQSLAAYQRRRAAIQLNDLLGRIWSSPLRRAIRGINRLFGRRYEWPSILDIANPSPADYPIVSSKMSNLFGIPYCHVVVCSEPKRST